MNRTVLTICLFVYGLCAGAQSSPARQAQYTQTARSATDRRPAEEKVYAHTDKEFYMAGEILWFKLYVVNATRHQPFDLSKIAYVELISDEQHPVSQAKIPLTRGLGDGSFQLPFSIHSGNYILRAYTNWMKNEDPAFYFEKTITILNSLRNSLPATATNVATTAGASQPPAATLPPPYDIRFFPEGGNLVDGLPGRLAFRIVDRFGKSRSCKGVVFNTAGDTLARFHTLRFGMGQFAFTPAKSSPCRALIELDDHTQLTVDLPPIEAKGYAMQMTDAGNGRLQVTVRTNIQGGDSLVWLSVHTRQSLKKEEPATISGGEARFMIDTDILEDGISHFTVFTGEEVPVCERLWFKYPARLKMVLHPGQDSYASRQKVTLDLTTLDAAGLPVEMNASMAVVLEDSLQAPAETDIQNYLLLSSDLKGRVESPAWYFSDNNAGAEEAMDLLMMTQGWRRFRWSAFQPKPAPSYTYPPEYAGLLISGKITDRQTGAPVGGIPAWLSAPGIRFRLAYSVSNKNGDIQWDLGTLYGVHELVVQTGDPLTDSLYRIDIIPPFYDSLSKRPLLPFQLTAGTKDQLLQHSIGAQAQNAYQPDKRQHFIQPLLTDTSAFYGRPDKRYLLDDYTRFSTMEEVMREYVREVRVRNNKGDFAIGVQSDQANELFFESTPLILVDGVPISDANRIIRFDPLKFRKMEIITRRYILGDSLFNGILSCSTYQGDLSGFPLDRNAYILEYEGLQLQREFYSPVYETRDEENSRIPDLRNVLYWSPRIKTDTRGRQQVSFYTSDVRGRYTVVLQGITSDGRVGSARTSFFIR
jgi:hypothetical protein